MEDVNAYIESGILELYVLGQLQPDELREVEAMAAKHPEVKEEIAAIELALEQYALANGIEPSQVLDTINLELPADKITAPAPAAEVVALQKTTNSRPLQFALVACLAMLVVSLVVLYEVHDKLNVAKAQIVQMNAEKQQFTRDAGYFEQQNKELKLIAAMPDHPEWARVKLKGTDKSPDANLLVYWNKEDHKVFVNNATRNLPAHDAVHQYQLWAMVDGKPVDLGVFDAKSDSAGMILEMKAVENAAAFAVTLEKLGGSAAPTMDELVVMGTL